jgi:hypothetical protein
LILDPWEFFCVLLMEGVKAANNENRRILPFFQVLTEDGVLAADEFVALEQQTWLNAARLDSARIFTIVFGKTLLWLLDQEDRRFSDTGRYSQQFTIFIRAFEEMLLKGQGREQRANDLSTGLLETTFVSLIAL